MMFHSHHQPIHDHHLFQLWVAVGIPSYVVYQSVEDSITIHTIPSRAADANALIAYSVVLVSVAHVEFLIFILIHRTNSALVVELTNVLLEAHFPEELFCSVICTLILQWV